MRPYLDKVRHVGGDDGLTLAGLILEPFNAVHTRICRNNDGGQVQERRCLQRWLLTQHRLTTSNPRNSEDRVHASSHRHSNSEVPPRSAANHYETKKVLVLSLNRPEEPKPAFPVQPKHAHGTADVHVQASERRLKSDGTVTAPSRHSLTQQISTVWPWRTHLARPLPPSTAERRNKPSTHLCRAAAAAAACFRTSHSKKTRRDNRTTPRGSFPSPD